MVSITILGTPAHGGKDVLVDWGSSGGPFIALTWAQLRALQAEMRRIDQSA